MTVLFDDKSFTQSQQGHTQTTPISISGLTDENAGQRENASQSCALMMSALHVIA